MSNKPKKMMHRVNLGADPGLRRSVFIKAKTHRGAETRALKRNPGWHIVKSPLPPI